MYESLHRSAEECDRKPQADTSKEILEALNVADVQAKPYEGSESKKKVAKIRESKIILEPQKKEVPSTPNSRRHDRSKEERKSEKEEKKNSLEDIIEEYSNEDENKKVELKFPEILKQGEEAEQPTPLRSKTAQLQKKEKTTTPEGKSPGHAKKGEKKNEAKNKRRKREHAGEEKKKEIENKKTKSSRRELIQKEVENKKPKSGRHELIQKEIENKKPKSGRHELIQKEIENKKTKSSRHEVIQKEEPEESKTVDIYLCGFSQPTKNLTASQTPPLDKPKPKPAKRSPVEAKHEVKAKNTGKHSPRKHKSPKKKEPKESTHKRKQK
ncbi:hypothetical protein Y032_0041g340 [Ancylostoma ceylanicum]|uniref:Uncharacterized protein n=1 Tax=Ancylostoma ceylanicum TaxID=53326 RepID=A0A016UHN4_9BILA|nr:hypothetical protein Y032_0041g340 [Ancylostoma ceylanicum]